VQDLPIPPGEFIQELLQKHGWTQRVIISVLGMDPAVLSKVISGKRQIDARMALGLADVFGVPAEQFLAVQRAYDLAVARQESPPDPTRAKRAMLFGNLPIPEMIKRGWLDVESVRDVQKVEAALSKFFGVQSAKEIESLPFAAKRSDTDMPISPSQRAWVNRVRQIAREMVVPRYSSRSLLAAIEAMKPLRADPSAVRKVPRILAEAGIRFVVVESLKGAKIDGACFWLDDGSPVVGVSIRFDRIDNFWFVLMHELEHVLREHGRKSLILDSDLEQEQEAISDEECVANAAAAEFCVSQEELAQFIARKAPLFPERDLIGFSRTLRVHPGLVVGQLQRKTGRYHLLRQHLAKVRTIVCPSAMVDGWGDVAPIATSV
jgi:HTH-type transcriptional regulator / antitoxin HigA